MPSRAPVAAATAVTTSPSSAGQHPAVRVTERDHVRPGLRGHPDHLERVGRVGPVPVEEVLGVQEHPLSLGAQMADRVADHRQVLLQRGPQGQPGHAGRDSWRQESRPAPRTRAERRPVGRSAACTPGRGVAPNAASCACLRSSSVRARWKNSVSLGIAPGQPPSMKPTPNSSRRRAIASLSATVRLSPSCGVSVAQRGVVDVEHIVGHDLGPSLSCGAGAPRAGMDFPARPDKKDPSRHARGLRVGGAGCQPWGGPLLGADAPADNDAAGRHAHSVTHDRLSGCTSMAQPGCTPAPHAWRTQPRAPRLCRTQPGPRPGRTCSGHERGRTPPSPPALEGSYSVGGA